MSKPHETTKHYLGTCANMETAVGLACFDTRQAGLAHFLLWVDI